MTAAGVRASTECGVPEGSGCGSWWWEVRFELAGEDPVRVPASGPAVCRNEGMDGRAPAGDGVGTVTFKVPGNQESAGARAGAAFPAGDSVSVEFSVETGFSARGAGSENGGKLGSALRGDEERAEAAPLEEAVLLEDDDGASGGMAGRETGFSWDPECGLGRATGADPARGGGSALRVAAENDSPRSSDISSASGLVAEAAVGVGCGPGV